MHTPWTGEAEKGLTLRSGLLPVDTMVHISSWPHASMLRCRWTDEASLLQRQTNLLPQKRVILKKATFKLVSGMLGWPVENWFVPTSLLFYLLLSLLSAKIHFSGYITIKWQVQKCYMDGLQIMCYGWYLYLFEWLLPLDFNLCKLTTISFESVFSFFFSSSFVKCLQENNNAAVTFLFLGHTRHTERYLLHQFVHS